MPIYAYRCDSCGHTRDVLRKLSDPPLNTCPSCGAATFRKQLTAAGFQLKGSGWYATDFKGGQAAKPESAKSEQAKPDAASPSSDPASNTPSANSAKADTPAAAASTSGDAKGAGSTVPTQ